MIPIHAFNEKLLRNILLPRENQLQHQKPWFYLHADHELIWAQPDADIPKRERQTVESQKMMLTIVWNPGGFHVLNMLPKGLKFNASSYVTQILDPLSE
jgi:D-hexose-6-phosphate mutarotase